MCWYIQPIKAQSILQPVLDLEKALKVFELDLEAVVETVHTNWRTKIILAAGKENWV